MRSICSPSMPSLAQASTALYTSPWASVRALRIWTPLKQVAKGWKACENSIRTEYAMAYNYPPQKKGREGAGAPPSGAVYPRAGQPATRIIPTKTLTTWLRDLVGSNCRGGGMMMDNLFIHKLPKKTTKPLQIRKIKCSTFGS